ncbi:hypothetical protein [Gracilibacillus alcaliphilus]|uniref:hypothetical protein n=1 Tax=Gracilibacillus alcaliphilus TaxID=1401441 RepID=UPI00195D8F60|nr:hypothetical protein [Gracilibacillus alcaliphilus]MBM7679366.1 hypothetical protein [Gracilibacillus alcaliphilus]
MTESWMTELTKMADYLLLTKQEELFLVIFLSIGLIICFFVLQPIVSILISIGWKTFLTYSLVIMIMVLIVTSLSTEVEGIYLMLSLLIFTAVVCFSKFVK